MNLRERLEQKISNASIDVERRHLECDLAIFHAREGFFSKAQAAYDSYHNNASFGADAQMSVKLILLDGLLAFFRDREYNRARRRIASAAKLAESYGLEDIRWLAEAWYCHVVFNQADYSSLTDRFKPCVEQIESLSAEASSRVALTIADMAALADEFGLARSWYDRAKRLADAIGDYLYVAAMLHNRSAIAISHYRFAAASGGRPAPEAAVFLPEIETVAAIDEYRSTREVLYPNQLWMARRKMLVGEHDLARHMLMAVIAEKRLQRSDVFFPYVLSDVAICQLRAGETASAVATFKDAASCDVDRGYADEVAVFYAQGAEILAENNSGLSSTYSRKAREFADRCADEKRQISSVLRKVCGDAGQ